MQAEKLNNSQRVGYGIADFGINLYFISAMTYLLYFYTDVFGLSAAAAAGVMGVARLIDAVTDPMMGAIAERTRSRRGRLRPYLLFGALPLAVVAVLTFTVPDLSSSGKLWWAYLTYVGVRHCVHGGVDPVLGPDRVADFRPRGADGTVDDSDGLRVRGRNCGIRGHAEHR